jgi:hypothetical protein
MNAAGPEDCLMELARQGPNWALPNLLLGAHHRAGVVLVYLFRPPRARMNDELLAVPKPGPRRAALAAGAGEFAISEAATTTTPPAK